jgi:hypothetical protein
MRLIERRAMPPFGHFCLIRFAKAAAEDSATDVEPAAAVA